MRMMIDDQQPQEHARYRVQKIPTNGGREAFLYAIARDHSFAIAHSEQDAIIIANELNNLGDRITELDHQLNSEGKRS